MHFAPPVTCEPLLRCAGVHQGSNSLSVSATERGECRPRRLTFRQQPILRRQTDTTVRVKPVCRSYPEHSANRLRCLFRFQNLTRCDQTLMAALPATADIDALVLRVSFGPARSYHRNDRYCERRHATALNHDAWPRLISMLAARSNSLAVGSAKSSAPAYRVIMLNNAHTAIASVRASVLTLA